MSMSSAESREIQFINFNPVDPSSTESQQRVHSHAASVAHARKRRLRVIEHQASKSTQQSKDDHRTSQRDQDERHRKLTAQNSVELEQSVIPSPVNQLESYRKDPFMSFATPFRPIEHFLFNHCESCQILSFATTAVSANLV